VDVYVDDYIDTSVSSICILSSIGEHNCSSKLQKSSNSRTNNEAFTTQDVLCSIHDDRSSICRVTVLERKLYLDFVKSYL
jgi:hypothetical protein